MAIINIQRKKNQKPGDDVQPTELHVIKCNDGYDLGMDNTKKFTEGNKDVLINYIYMDLHITR